MTVSLRRRKPPPTAHLAGQAEIAVHLLTFRALTGNEEAAGFLKELNDKIKDALEAHHAATCGV